LPRRRIATRGSAGRILALAPRWRATGSGWWRRTSRGRGAGWRRFPRRFPARRAIARCTARLWCSAPLLRGTLGTLGTRCALGLHFGQ
jgi:hypothetical protein